MHQHILLSVSGFVHEHQNLLIVLFIGIVAGILAQLIVGDRGLGMLFTLILGIAGGWLGDRLFKSYLNFTDSPFLNTIIRATAGAIILAFVVNLLLGFSKKDKDRTDWQA